VSLKKVYERRDEEKEGGREGNVELERTVDSSVPQLVPAGISCPSWLPRVWIGRRRIECASLACEAGECRVSRGREGKEVKMVSSVFSFLPPSLLAGFELTLSTSPNAAKNFLLPSASFSSPSLLKNLLARSAAPSSPVAGGPPPSESMGFDPCPPT